MPKATDFNEQNPEFGKSAKSNRDFNSDSNFPDSDFRRSDRDSSVETVDGEQVGSFDPNDPNDQFADGFVTPATPAEKHEETSGM